MKKIKDIENFKRLEGKSEYSQLRDLTYAINGVIIKYSETYAFPNIVNEVKNELVTLFKQIADLKPHKEAYDKSRQIVLNKGRDIVKALIRYNKNFKYDTSCIEAASKSAKYQVFSFLKNKEHLDFETAFGMMQRNKLINESINIINEKCDGKIFEPNFNRLQNDLIKLLVNTIESYDFAS